MAQSRSWCFTVPNYHDEQLLHLQLLAEDPRVSYLIFGREVSPGTGLRHLQGYVRFDQRLRFASVRGLLPQCHLTSARGSPEQNFLYCSKDGDFDEFGARPVSSQGRRSDFERYRDWCIELGRLPTERELVDNFVSLYGRYRHALHQIAREVCPPAVLRDGDLRPWQTALYERLQGQADDRSVEFFVDRDGGFGKSWFCGYAYSRIELAQLLGPGKRDDLAHAVDCRSRVFLFNIPRGQIEYLNYGLLEMLKDRMVLSPKYESQMKILHHVPHVVVFTNEEPDMTKMSEDRYRIEYLS